MSSKSLIGRRCTISTATVLQNCRVCFKFLSNCVVGASQEEGGDEEDAESVDSDAPVVVKEGTYQIIGTMSDPQAPKPEWVKYVLDVS